MSDIRLVELRENLSGPLEEIKNMLPEGWKVTLVARSTTDKDQYLALSDDELVDASNALKRAIRKGEKV